MNDTKGPEPDHARLFAVASEQSGYFTAEQARECGFSFALLSHHAGTGRFVRIRRGLYRLREYPTSPREEVLAAWLAVGRDLALVSHESALDLHGLSDLIPDEIHLTVPRSRRGRRPPAGVRLHTAVNEQGPGDVVVRDGVRLTAPARTIVEVAAARAAPEQVVAAVREALDRGLATRSQLQALARDRGGRVERLIRRALEEGIG